MTTATCCRSLPAKRRYQHLLVRMWVGGYLCQKHHTCLEGFLGRSKEESAHFQLTQSVASLKNRDKPNKINKTNNCVSHLYLNFRLFFTHFFGQNLTEKKATFWMRPHEILCHPLEQQMFFCFVLLRVGGRKKKLKGGVKRSAANGPSEGCPLVTLIMWGWYIGWKKKIVFFLPLLLMQRKNNVKTRF